MDWVTFLSRSIDALAWPITVVIVALVFRRPILELLPLLRHVRFRDMELQFGKELASARKETEELEFQRGVTFDPVPRFQKAVELATAHPPAAIMEAWKIVEDELRQLAVRTGQEIDPRDPSTVFTSMRREGRIGPGAGSLFNRLRRLRNEAAHSINIDIGEGQALEYVDLAETMAAFISNLGKKRSARPKDKS
ncbi:hypothetical protein [Pelagibius sp.]|uniref:hypothetical protein n=1 Tax=Pelagibius sp. TaxID=1931238 RepID=UPI0026129415|nr:hypothetical protein [Pelagibius sp.]